MTAIEPRLTRELRSFPGYAVGQDVDAMARGLHRFLGTGKLGEHERKPKAVREAFGPGKSALARQARARLGLTDGTTAGFALDRMLRKEGAYDELADALFVEYIKAKATPVLPKVVYPHPKGYLSTVCQGIHDTAGLPGNVAMDFCCKGATPVVAPVDCEVVKISGRNPALGADQVVGIFGWNLHLMASGGYRLFGTHFGAYTVRVGQKVKRGTVIGYVGNWPGNPARSHLHLGVTSIHGRQDASRYILDIAAAQRVKVKAYA